MNIAAQNFETMELGLEGSWQYFSDEYKNVFVSSRTRKLPNGHVWAEHGEQRNNKWNVVQVKALCHLPTRFFFVSWRGNVHSESHSLNGVNATKGVKVILTGNGDFWRKTLPSLMLFVPFLKSKKVQEEEFATQGQWWKQNANPRESPKYRQSSHLASLRGLSCLLETMELT